MWVMRKEEAIRAAAMPFTAKGQALASGQQSSEENGNVLSEVVRKCLPVGVPTMMLSEFAIEIVESPERVTIISEISPLVRSVYLTRTGPTEGLERMWNGYSTGRWEGDVLIIKTNYFNDRLPPVDYDGSVHSPTSTIYERLSVSDDGQTMTDEVTMEDPEYLTRPYTVTRHYDRLPDNSELWESVCEIGGKGWSERFQGDSDAPKSGN